MATDLFGPIIAWASQKPVIQECWLFGSRARGDHRPDSDVDLAIFLTVCGQEGWREFYWSHGHWDEELSEILGISVNTAHGNQDYRTDEVFDGLTNDGILVYQRDKQK